LILFNWRPIAEAAVQPLAVVEDLNVVEQLVPGFVMVGEAFVVRELLLERTKEAFRKNGSGSLIPF